MKKLMTLMLGLSLALGCVATSFAQDGPARKTNKKNKKKLPKKNKNPRKNG
jgi:hypothetical protein